MIQIDRVFLDTNIIWNINTFGEEITNAGHFDVDTILVRYGQKVLEDVLALKDIYSIFDTSHAIEFAAHPETIEELAKKGRDKRNENRMILAADEFIHLASVLS